MRKWLQVNEINTLKGNRDEFYAKMGLIKEGKLKPDKEPPKTHLNEKPYEIPSGWVWSCLSEIGITNPRNECKDNTVASFVPMPLISADFGIEIKSDARKWKEIKKGFTHFAENDVSLAKITPCFENGKSAVMRNLHNGFGAGTTELHVFRNILPIVVPDYVLVFLKSPRFIREGIPRMTGSAGQKRVPKEYFSFSPFPLPPYKEQLRIVEKINSLLNAVNELKTQKEKRNKKHIFLNNASIENLLSSQKPSEFKTNWKNISDHFDLLYDNPQNIRKLKQAILQLAVMGKLVPQDPKSEPASVLLEKIQKEKERLVKEGKLKKEKPLPPIKDEEKPYELPEGWEWVRLKEICLKITDGTHHSPPNKEKGEFKYVTAKNIKNEGVLLSNITYVTKKTHEEIYARCNPSKGDVLYIKDGATTGIVTINNLDEPFSMLSSVALLKPSSNLLNKYLMYALRSPFFYATMRGDMSGVAITRVTLTKMIKALFPLPPLSEQQLIVEKIEELMETSEQLEAQLFKVQNLKKYFSCGITNATV